MVSLSEAEFSLIVEALKSANRAANYVVQLCEADLEAGSSPNPFIKSNPHGAMASCYGAMNFNRKVIEALKVLEKSNG